MKRWERLIVITSGALISLALASSLRTGRPDQIAAAVSGLASLFVPPLVRRAYPSPGRGAWPWVSPFYSDGIYTLFSIFIAAHITFIEVPFLNLDLYNGTWGYADVPSHFLGGLVTWLIFNEVVVEASRTYGLDWSSKRIVGISFSALLFVGVLWEILEVFLQSEMPWLQESLANKIQDITMEVLGFLTGLWLVGRFEYPYPLPPSRPVGNSRKETGGSKLPAHRPDEVEKELCRC